MNYIALYRKHRPKNFQNVVGQKVITQTLKNAIKHQKIHHCYLFSGDKGVGKTTLAKVLAKSINCSFFLKNQDCCEYNDKDCCESCFMIDQKQTLDVIEIDGASYSGVDDIRELKDKLHYKPNSLKYKIYIIDEVHVLSYNAFNALLKVLEEPSTNVVFILVTSEFHKIPKNFFSRAQYFYLYNISAEDIEKKLITIASLENILISEKALKQIAFYSNGSLRDALNLLDQVSAYVDGNIEEQDITEILGTVSETQIKELFQILFQNNIKNLISFLEKILSHSNINYVLFLNDFINFIQKKLIHYFQKNEKNFSFFANITVQQREKIFQKLLELQDNLTLSKYKKNLLIIRFIEINNFLCTPAHLPDTKNLNPQKSINASIPTKPLAENPIFLENNLPFVSEKISQKSKETTKLKQNILSYIINILMFSNDKARDLIVKGWQKLENYPILELANTARLLYNSKLLSINLNKVILLACRDEIEYKQLLTIDTRIKIKQILNAKKNLINDYFVILNKDWEEIIKPVYLKFLETKNKEDLDLSHLKTDFYEKNSVLSIEQNNSTIVKLARDLFGYEKVEIN